MKKLLIAFLLTSSTAIAQSETALCTNCQTAKVVKPKQFIGDAWRGYKFTGRTDLRYATFDGDFSGADFTGCDLTGATLKGLAQKAIFYSAIMRGFKFKNVNAAGSNFKLADLTHATVSGRFSGGNFKMAALDFVNAKRSNFDSAYFNYASLHKFNGTNASFFKANLYRAVITNSVLYNVNMGLSNVTGAVFADNDLRKINQFHVQWNKANYLKNNNKAGSFSEFANPQ